MPFTKIKTGKKKGKYKSPSGRTFTRKQVARYHARGGRFDACACHMRDASSVLMRGDPTGTGKLRRLHKSRMDSLWRRFKGALRTSVVQLNMLGLSGQKSAMSLMMTTLPGDGKVRAFQTMVDNTLKQVFLDPDHLDSMVARAYAMGVARGIRLSASANRPQVADDHVATLQQLSFVELQGICEAVSQRLVRDASLALTNNAKPIVLYQQMAKSVSSVGIVRTHALIEVMVNKSFNTGTLDQFEVAGITKVGTVPETVRKPRVFDAKADNDEIPSARTIRRIRVKEKKIEELDLVNVLTAGDDLVCEECEGIAEDGPYDTDTARSLIPAHPSCRCAFIPVFDRRFAEPEDDE